ncbi:hypothetical protein FOA52_007544 [Chlamydomonas sp. UWO 241]|nr:hypothetical protein FOA52_007544 [Chlamydomonas sp. UWO 241]
MDGDGLLPDVCGLDLDPERELELPEECWMAVLGHCAVREVCMLGRTNRWLRELASTPSLWSDQYARLFGEPPGPALNGATVRRKCRHSCIRAARWLEADVVKQTVGFPDTVCLQLDDRKVVSSDGCSVRVWSHEEGRRSGRVSVLQGHTSPVTCVAYDDNRIVSGDASGMLRTWGIDDLKPSRTLGGRAAHGGGRVAGVGMLAGRPMSAGSDGFVRMWDASSGQPTTVLEGPRGAPIAGLAVAPDSGRVVSCGDGVHVWDVGTMELLHDLGLPDSLIEEGSSDAAPPSFLCVSHFGSVLAAGTSNGSVVLWDVRCADAIGVIRLPMQPRLRVCGGAASGWAVGSAEGPGVLLPTEWADVSAVQLDDWKLVVAFNAAGAGGAQPQPQHTGGDTSAAAGVVAVYDMRSAPGAARLSSDDAPSSSDLSRNAQPLLALPTRSRIETVRFHGALLMAGLSGREAVLWSFGAPGGAHGATMASLHQARFLQAPRARAPCAPVRARVVTVAVCASGAVVDVESAMKLILRDGYKVLDVRSSKAYDDQHITKPARSSVGVPFLSRDGTAPDPRFVAEVSSSVGPSKSTPMLVMCQDGGDLSRRAMEALSEAGFTGALQMEGGYSGWGQMWSSSGKRKPPPGRWVSTGKESLKSGLNIPGVAESYDEGGNLAAKRVARGLAEGEELPPMER